MTDHKMVSNVTAVCLLLTVIVAGTALAWFVFIPLAEQFCGWVDKL